MENMRDAFGKALTRLAAQRYDFVLIEDVLCVV